MSTPEHLQPSPGTSSIRCPFCEAPLQSGIIEMNYTFWGVILAGWSHLVLKFHGAGGSREILRPGRTRAGYLCPTCGTLVSPGSLIRLPRPTAK